jgi:hypothetical protein
MTIDSLPIYVLTLRQTPERTEYAKQHLASHGLTPQFYYGFHGKSLGVQPLRPYMRDFNSDPTRHQPSMVAPGVVGCALSWFGLVKHILLAGHAEALVLEDDAELCVDFRSKFEEFYHAIPRPWDVVYLGGDYRMRTASMVTNGVGTLTPPPLCTHAIMVSRYACKVIDATPQVQQVDGPVDVTFHDELLPRVRWYCALPALVGQLSGDEYPLDGGKARMKSCIH